MATGAKVNVLKSIRLCRAARIRNVVDMPNLVDSICINGPYTRAPEAAPARAIPDARARRLLKYLVRITIEGNKPRLAPSPQTTP